MIKNSIGTKMFASCFFQTESGKEDLLNNGEFSCAYFVSSMLKIFDWIEKPHTTVDSTERDMINCGWKKVSATNMKEGSVIVWKAIMIGNTYNRHIGFYIGDGKAVSASYKLKRIVLHDITGGKREIEAVYWKNIK
ncbi:MAG: NlpC/P60 family protein [Desulfobacteraceae bacterium]|nr:NlpC/P60 family protein [Desulfobacteraceae bacterium]